MSVNLMNQRFGRLVVVKQAGENKWNQYLWLCQCDCGNKKIVSGYSLKNGDTQSCKCLQKEGVIRRNTKHNYARRKNKSKTYIIWTSMIQRCVNQNSRDYNCYGGRGIKVCQRWMNFENFLEDVGEPPTENHSLDRINNNKGYCKENCRWATQKEQARNKNNNNLQTYNGKTQCLSAWAEEYEINYQLLWKRVCVYRWSVEKALTTLTKQQRKCLL